jgi:hypothetical protein
METRACMDGAHRGNGCSRWLLPQGTQANVGLTPPTLEWVVTNDETNEQQTFAGSGSIQASQGDAFLVTLKAKDPEGLLRITISSNVGWSCSSGDMARMWAPRSGWRTNT